MSHKIFIHREAKKAYKKLPVLYQVKVKATLIKLAENPFRQDLDIKALHGQLKGKYRIREGEIRIVYVIEKNDNIVYVEGISYRGNAY